MTIANEPSERPPLRLTAPGRDGGLVELIHVLAAILARFEREQIERSPQPHGKAEG